MNSLKQELLTALANQRGWVVLPILFNAGALTALAWDTESRHWMTSWYALLTAMLLVRWLVLTRVLRVAPLSVDTKLRVAMLISLSNGVVQASAVSQFAHFPGHVQLLLSLVFTGQVAGAVATSIGYAPLVLTYLVPMLGGVAVAWFLEFQGQGRMTEAYLTVGMVLVSAVVFMSIAREMHRVLRESFEIRSREAGLAARLLAANGELTKQQATLERALEEKERAIQSKTRFLAAASHDMRQPLHAMSLLGAALLNRPLDSRSREIAVCSNEAIGQLTSELDSLLDISKLDAGVVQPQFVSVDLCRAMDAACVVLEPLAKHKGLSIRRRYAPNIFVRSDPSLLDRVLRNLIENAIKYTERGHVDIATKIEDNSCVLAIADTGIGIADDQVDRVFEEFFQVANPERDRARGLGLGLSIVKRLCSILHHQIELRSQIGRWTEFTLRLPLAAQPQTRSGPRAAAIFPAGLKVLIIDDERQVQVAMQTLLEENGCQSFTAGSVADALNAASQFEPDIVISDLRLRGAETGVQAIRAVRSLRGNLPALLISGDTSPQRLLEAADAGIRLLHKPVRFADLVEAVYVALDGRKHGSRN